MTTGQSSLNRLNLGASMTRLGSTHIVTSSLSYNFVLHLPDKNTSRHVTSIPRCKGWLPNYNNGTMGTKCATGIGQIRDALQAYRDNTYDDIKIKIEQIYNMLPPELDTQSGGRRSKKGLINFAGDLLLFVTGVATQTELQGLYDRMQVLEQFISENQDSNRLQLT